MKPKTIVFLFVAVTAVPFDEFYKDPNATPATASGATDTSTSIPLLPPLLYHGIEYGCCKIHLDGLVELYIDMACQSSDIASIAPFHKDITKTPKSSEKIYIGDYKEATTDSEMLKMAEDQIRSNFTESEFSPSYLIIATWEDVTLDSEYQNTFQAVIATNGSVSFAMFLYDKLEWDETLAPQVFFSSSTNIVWEMPCSGFPKITAMANTSNVEVPGMWLFRIDKDIIPACTSKDACESDELCSCLLETTDKKLCECPCSDENTCPAIASNCSNERTPPSAGKGRTESQNDDIIAMAVLIPFFGMIIIIAIGALVSCYVKTRTITAEQTDGATKREQMKLWLKNKLPFLP